MPHWPLVFILQKQKLFINWWFNVNVGFNSPLLLYFILHLKHRSENRDFHNRDQQYCNMSWVRKY